MKLVLLKRRCSWEGKIWWLAMQLRDNETKVEQVFKVGTRRWLNKFSRPSMMIQKGDAKGNQNEDRKKNSMQH
jgi:hypothetical protein